jgi:S1-C subfamily serine protease
MRSPLGAARWVAAVLLTGSLAGGLAAQAAEADAAQRPWGRAEYVAYMTSGKPLAPLEGIWIFPDNAAEIAIAQYAPGAGGEFEYFGVVVSSPSPRWRVGEPVLFMKSTATPTIFVGTWAERDGGGGWRDGPLVRGGTVLLKNPNMIEVLGPRGNQLLVRMYPKSPGGAAAARLSEGTGFFVSRRLVATSHHVVDGARTITVRMGELEAIADVVLQDAGNDLALLRLRSSDALELGLAARGERCAPLGDALAVKPGDRVYTLGFPLGDVLGKSLKVSEGIVSSTTGLRNDPTVFQVSVPIQPGSSGSPVFDASGRVIAVVSGTLNARALLSETGAAPQNVNFAVKAVYLQTLLSFVPDAACPAPPVKSGSAADVQQALGLAVVQVRVEE